MSTYSFFIYRTCIVLVDCSDRIVAVLGGVPPGSRGSDWRSSMDNLTAAVKECSMKSTFTAKEMNHPRGDFTARAAGFSYGGGRERPGNVRITGEGNKAAMDELLNHEDMVRLVGFTNSLYNSFNHKTYVEYKETLESHLVHNPRLRPTSSKTVFAATTINFGPRTIVPPHIDGGNTGHGWCSDSSLGPYNPDKGGHLVLWNLGLIIRFPPGATVLFPSALITHSTVPIQPDETRYSIVQYSAGGLFRWRNNGWCSDKVFLQKASKDQLKQRKVENAQRWSMNLEKFTHWSDLIAGDWQGKRRAVKSEEGPPEKRSCY
ncbi:hypothetical protein F5051DRAFT_340995 [Lentinula edodes]|nr:hypothetical protein F5051DRAFT_340995 [Lentinula edodes]